MTSGDPMLQGIYDWSGVVHWSNEPCISFFKYKSIKAKPSKLLTKFQVKVKVKVKVEVEVKVKVKVKLKLKLKSKIKFKIKLKSKL